MPEWLSSIAVEEVVWTTMVLRLSLAAAFGLIVAGVYNVSSQGRARLAAFPLITTLVLLTILVAMTTIVIGDSVARAFGLVGALSIVRFRTVVDDTRDTAFVIFAVVVGMAVGSGHLLVCAVGIPVVSLAAIGLGCRQRPKMTGSLSRRLNVRLSIGQGREAALENVLRTAVDAWRLVEVVSVRQGAAFDLVYAVRLRDSDGVLPLTKAVHAIEGVQSVEIKE